MYRLYVFEKAKDAAGEFETVFVVAESKSRKALKEEAEWYKANRTGIRYVLEKTA